MKLNKSWFIRLSLFFICALALASCMSAPVFAQSFARPDGSIPVPLDWTSKHVLFTSDFTPDQAAKMRNEPRVYALRLHHDDGRPISIWRRKPPKLPRPPLRSSRKMGRDWAVSLGAGGVAQGMSPAKYTFDVNAAPSCALDFAVFPINASTGNTRANVVGTFTGEPAAGATTAITITPAGKSAVTLTLTSSAASNTGLNFQISATIATNAANLAAAINRNLNSSALDRIVAVALGAKVTVYALTPGNGVTLTDANALTNFTWGAVTAGTDGTQANIIAFNQLYSGSGTPLCVGFTNPEFIFSYASGVGPVATSPNLSLDGKKISYVENDLNIGAILHVLTIGSGSTEYGTVCASTNNGTSMPTCATNPVIPGSTATSTATDFMLPLGLVAANAATGAAGAADSFSSPFTDYVTDTTFVGDNNGYLYSIKPTFNATPAYAGGNFPVHVSATPASVAPTAVTASTTVVTVTVANTLGIGELVTIAGVAANNGNGCTAADVAVINGTQTVIAAGLSGAKFEFNATIPSATTGCNVAGATVTPGSNYLSAPVVDVSGTGNIFVGDSSANLYELTPAGTTAAPSLSVGENLNGGIRDAPMIDSTNAVGYVVTACTAGTTGGETDTTNSALIQFKFTSNTLTQVAAAGLDSGANQACTVAGFPLYAATPDDRYFVLGIASATAANNGEFIAASSGTGGQQIKAFQFVSSVLQTAPEGADKPQLGTGASVISPLTEFFNSQQFAVTGLTATAAVVTVTAANTLAANDLVTISGVIANPGNGCTGGPNSDLSAINGVLQTVASATPTQFTFDATIPSPTMGTGCTVTGATATGGPDYMFMAVNQNPTELYSFLLPAEVLVPGLDNAPTPAATNTADIVGGTSAMIVDNNSTAGQASSMYFGTLATSTTVCGATAAFCAVKLTQVALQ
ncbi:MAG: hypothetical protein WB780_24635 [Candidatus Acidiferrales bacterium]